MQNYHRHTCGSNIFTPDSTMTNEHYAKRAVELGHKVLSTVEHGWQGKYHDVYELAHKYNLKMVFGTEAYWVWDRHTKDKSNHHIVLLAKNENGRQAINDALSEASISGYYFKPRVDLEILLSLPPDDVFVTSACIAFRTKDDSVIDEDSLATIKKYGGSESINLNQFMIEKLHEHFGNNFMLEIQYHNADVQKEWNTFLKQMHEQLGIELIVGLDSHYINSSQAVEREELLAAKGIHYEDEEGFYLDYPDDETVMQRFLEQGIFDRQTIQRAMDNTDICLTFGDYDDVSVFNHERKIPTLYPELSQEQKNKKYSQLITKKFKEYTKDFPPDKKQEYFEAVQMEVNTYKDTGLVDYPLLNYRMIDLAVNKYGGHITHTGRGSAVGYLTNTLCGFSSVDRLQAPIKLYPERFISRERIIETNSLPDWSHTVPCISNGV